MDCDKIDELDGIDWLVAVLKSALLSVNHLIAGNDVISKWSSILKALCYFFN
jgi:hypothetical protein